MAVEPKRRRFTAAEYHQMAAVGILDEDDRVELLDGEIVEMTPIGHRRAACVYRMNDLFSRVLGDSALVAVQNPVHLGERTEPQPDLALLSRKPDFYASGHPTARDVFLLVEVAETSVETDRRVKMPLYARHGIPEAWLVDLEQKTITVYQNPSRGGYRTARVVRSGEQIAPAAFPNSPVAAADVIPE